MNPATLNLIKSALRLDRSLDSAERASIVRLLTAEKHLELLPNKTQRFDAYLSPREAAAYLGFSKRTLARYVASGRIKPARLNARVLRFRKSDLDIFVAGDDIKL